MKLNDRIRQYLDENATNWRRDGTDDDGDDIIFASYVDEHKFVQVVANLGSALAIIECASGAECPDLAECRPHPSDGG